MPGADRDGFNGGAIVALDSGLGHMSEASRLSAKRLENFKEVIGGADLP